MHKPTLQSEHSYLERDCFFGRLTVVLQTRHRRFPPLVSDGKWRAVSLSGLSVEGRPLLGSRWLPYLSKICRITCRRNQWIEESLVSFPCIVCMRSTLIRFRTKSFVPKTIYYRILKFPHSGCEIFFKLPGVKTVFLPRPNLFPGLVQNL